MAPKQRLVRKKEASAKKKDWIYWLSKADLETELDIDGNLDACTTDLAAMSISTSMSFAAPTVSSEPPAAPSPPPDPDLRPAKVMSQMWKWVLHFDGKDPWSFLE